MARALKCAKCGASMEEGFGLDQTYGYRAVSAWIKGAPERSLWAGVKVRGEPKPIETHRCTSCGYLESYAK